MITVTCCLLLRDINEARLLVALNDPERGITPDDPVYLPDYAVRFEPVDELTGECGRDHPLARGNGLLHIPDNLWEHCPNLVARVLEADRRRLAAERAEAERQRKASARTRRQDHDRQIRAHKDPRQKSLL